MQTFLSLQYPPLKPCPIQCTAQAASPKRIPRTSQVIIVLGLMIISSLVISSSGVSFYKSIFFNFPKLFEVTQNLPIGLA